MKFQRLLFRLLSPILRKAASQFTIVSGSRSPVFASSSYRAFVDHGYKQVVWVYRCVKEIAEAVASVRFGAMVGPSKDSVVSDDHEIVRLLEHPNLIQSRIEFLMDWATFYLLGGAAFWAKLRASADNNSGRVLEMWNLRPDWVEVLPHAVEMIGGYSYTAEGARPVPFSRQQVVYFKNLDPLDPLKGLSPVLPGWRIIQMDNSILEWNKALFDNAAVPGGFLLMDKEASLGPDQEKKLREDIEEHFSGEGRHRPMILKGGFTDWKQWGYNQKDMDFVALTDKDALAICALFGVPPEIVGAGERPKFENYGVARLSFWEETIVPLVDFLVTKFNNEVAPAFGDNIRLYAKLRSVPAMREAFSMKVNMAERLVGMGWPLNAVNSHLDLGFEPVPWGDVGYLPATLVPATLLLSGESEEDDDEKALHRLRAYKKPNGSLGATH